MKRTKLIFMPLKNLVQGIGRGFLLIAILFAFGMNSALATNYVGEQEAIEILSSELRTTWNKIDTKVIYGENAVANAELKMTVMRDLVSKLKEGKTVEVAITEVLGNYTNGHVKVLDAHMQYQSNPKTGPNNSWLRQEIIELLSQ